MTGILSPVIPPLTGGSGGGSGTVTAVSVVTAHGFAGTVGNPTTTPAITLTTSVTGILKGDGTSISAATADTDYLTPGTAASTYVPQTTAVNGHALSGNISLTYADVGADGAGAATAALATAEAYTDAYFPVSNAHLAAQ